MYHRVCIMWKKIKIWIQQYFNFSHSESNGLLCLILIILFSILLPPIGRWYYRVSGKVSAPRAADMALLDQHLALLQTYAPQVKRININTATAHQLVESIGFPFNMAMRIIRYRDKLGGFISQDQYKEVYGMTKRMETGLRAKTIITADYTPQKLALNDATFQELLAHPYITPLIAKSIINYRTKQGAFTHLQAIQALPNDRPHWAKKILPYLAL